MNKNIAAVNAESGSITDLEIPPGTTVRDALTQLGALGERSLTLKDGQPPLAENDNLYAAVEDGQKVYLSTPISVAILVNSGL